MSLVVKSIKAAMKGSKRCKIAYIANGVFAADGDHALYIKVDETAPGEINFESVAEMELHNWEYVYVRPAFSREITGKYVSGDEWKSVAWCADATDTEASRYALGGVLFDGQAVVGTDGRRMHVAHLVSYFGDNKKQIVPKRTVVAVSALMRMFKDEAVWVEFKENDVVFMTENWKLSGRLMEGRFPMWEQVDPRKNAEAVLEKVTLHKAVIECAKKEIARHKLLLKAGKIDKDSTPRIEVKSESYKQILDANFVVDAMLMLRGSSCLVAWVPQKSAYPVVFEGDDSAAIVMNMSW